MLFLCCVQQLGPCHHVMARPSVADGGMIFRYGRYVRKYWKKVVDNWEGVVLQLAGWKKG